MSISIFSWQPVCILARDSWVLREHLKIIKGYGFTFLKALLFRNSLRSQHVFIETQILISQCPEVTKDNNKQSLSLLEHSAQTCTWNRAAKPALVIHTEIKITDTLTTKWPIRNTGCIRYIVIPLLLLWQNNN